MDSKRVSQFRSQLLASLAALTREDDLGRDGQRTVELDQQSVGRLSRMDALQQQAMARATQTRWGQARHGVEAALARIDDGEFGFCSECGDEIALRRLELDPTVPTCVSCASGR